MSTHHFEELELIAEKAGELNDRVGKIENELGTQTKTLESAALVLDAAIKGLGALKSSVLENDLGALQLALNDKTTHLAREIGRFETAVAEIDRRAEAGDAEIKSALQETAKSLRAQFDAKQAELSEWSAKVELTLAEQAKALAAIPPVIKGADAPTFNPRGEWAAGTVANKLDVVSYAGSSYISNIDRNTDKPGKSDKYTTLAKRAGSIAMGGVGNFAGLAGVMTPGQFVSGATTFAIGDVFYADTTGTVAKLAAGTSGKFLQTQGAGAAPIWQSQSGTGAGDFSGPGTTVTANSLVRFSGTGGANGKESGVVVDDSGNISASSTGAHVFGTTNTITIVAGVLKSKAGLPAAPASGSASFSGYSTDGALIYGNGSVNDFSLLNASGTAVLSVAHNTTTAVFSGTISTAAPTGGAGAWKLGVASVVSPTSPNRTIAVEIGGSIFYLAAKTTND